MCGASTDNSDQQKDQPTKTCFKDLFHTPALLATLGLILADQMTAQTFTTLHSFTATSGPFPSTNSDGANPEAGLILSGNILYGTTSGGGIWDKGTLFAINTNGTGFVTLHSFTSGDGAYPNRPLILSGNALYGTTSGGGTWDNGTVFAINTNGTGFTSLHSFTSAPYPGYVNSDGVYPIGLILSGNIVYGTALSGGSSNSGNVFRLNTDGTGFTTLHSFTGGSDGDGPNGLILSGNTLYGTAAGAGIYGAGTVFRVNTDGTGLATLHSFTATSPYPGPYTNSDGLVPQSGLILSGNTLYGTAIGGGISGQGTVFSVNTDGTGFTTLHSFTASGDGAFPYAELILSGNTLYGTAYHGGSSGHGTVFAINTNGTGFTNLHSFTLGTGGDCPTNSDGAYPQAGLLSSGNTLYGTANGGGGSGAGTVFSLSFAPLLTIKPSGGDVVLTWPTNYAGFDYTGYILQSTTNLVSPVWTTNSPAPVVINGQNTVINPISGTKQFFRLSQ